MQHPLMNLSQRILRSRSKHHRFHLVKDVFQTNVKPSLCSVAVLIPFLAMFLGRTEKKRKPACFE